jgi:hypothetical protein
MATTQTLEENYQYRTRFLPTEEKGQKVVYRYFRVPVKEWDALLPATGDTHSVNTNEIVIRTMKQGPNKGARSCVMVVVYLAERPYPGA